MRSSWNRNWIKALFFALVILATLSCNFSDLFGVTPEIQEVEVTRIVTVEPAGPPIDLAGIWYNPSTHSRTTIIWDNNEFRVISVVDTDDGDVYPVTASDWNGTRIRWSYYVPDTTYNVTFTMTSLEGDELYCDWFNDHDRSGTRIMERQEY
ncbi:MAG TPA: hypothetical protein G4O08_07930 [Anaerolineae bacterium]|nr:hypothetical protein [Anaerolineae bacterium]